MRLHSALEQQKGSGLTFSGLGPWAAMAPEPKKKIEFGSLLLFESAVQTHLRSVPSSLCEPAVVYGGFAHVYYCTFQS